MWLRSCGQSDGEDQLCCEEASSHLGCSGCGVVVMEHGRLKGNALIPDEMTDQGQNLSSSWLDTPPGGTKGAVEVDCAGAVGLSAGEGLAVSRVPVCCLSFCLESSCDSLMGPIFLAGTGVLCCCDADEDLHALRCWPRCPSL